MPFAARRLYRRLGRRLLWLYVGFKVTTALIITAATVALFSLYGDVSSAWRTAISIPRRLVFVSGWKPFAIISLPAAIF